MNKQKVGIVMLSYNRADVVLPCLCSLVEAKSGVEFELYLLDNASEKDQFLLIKDEFEKLQDKKGLKGVLIRSDVNHGFPKGNNLGIEYFLKNNGITHICLLNSDVIVSDNWLDYLVSSGNDAVGPVTNACGNEQTIPTELILSIENDNFDSINSFSKERHQLLEGCQVETDFLGFFCFLAKKELFSKVGFLDEQFGRGAFEDDDYCLRMIKGGYKMSIMRDVFVYHWGSSSFSRIPVGKLNEHLEKNKALFEKKYAIKWKERKWLPMKSFQQDMDCLLKKKSDPKVRNIFNLYYGKTEELAKNIAIAEKSTNIPSDKASLSMIHKVAFLRKAGKASKILLKNKNILFLVRFPNNEDLKDGYFQRVMAIDNFLSSYNRIYINYIFDDSAQGLFPKIIKVKEKVYEIRPYVKNPIHMILVAAVVFLIGRIYLHSILRLQSKFNRVLYLISRKKIIDIHGVVPEEFKMHGDLNGYEVFDKIEKFAVKYADVVIGVTGKMIDHLLKKHPFKKRGEVLIFPILPEARQIYEESKKSMGQSIIYCGGLQKWQQTGKMLEFVNKNKNLYKFAFLTPEPQKLKEIYSDKYKEEFPGIVKSVEASQVKDWYKEYSFGLVLREDIIVNNAACPTKIIEYFQNDILPVVDSENIGDFKELGYRYITYRDSLPNQEEWKMMIDENRNVLKKIYKLFEENGKKLKRSI